MEKKYKRGLVKENSTLTSIQNENCIHKEIQSNHQCSPRTTQSDAKLTPIINVFFKPMMN